MSSITKKLGLLAATLRAKQNEMEHSNSEMECEQLNNNNDDTVHLRRVYTSEHLLSLRNQDYCTRKPTNLPDLDIVLSECHYKFHHSDAYVMSKENDRSFKEYLRVLIERGFDDTEFCGTFCQNIIALEPKDAGKSGFKSFINTFIEIEFEKVIFVSYDIEEKEKQIEETGDVRLKMNLQQELTVAKHFYHIKLGLAKLIGELYRIGVLNVRVVIRALERLLFIGGTESLESLYWLCYQITDKLRKDCGDYVEQTGIQTDLFSFYVLKLNEYLTQNDLNADVRAKIEQLFQAVNGCDGCDQNLVTNNGSGDRMSKEEDTAEATFEFD